MRRAGLDEEEVSAAVERCLQWRDEGEGPDIPLDERARRVIDLAYKEEENLGFAAVGTEHLLLGLVIEGGGCIEQELGQLDVRDLRRRAHFILAESQRRRLKDAKEATHQMTELARQVRSGARRLAYARQVFVSPELLLLAMALELEPGAYASRIIRELGNEWDRIRPRLRSCMKEDFDQVDWVSDSPSSEDDLHRKPLAEALAKRLNRIRAEGVGTPFLVHLDGPWGSGKSTLLHFLEDELRPEWLTVKFNPWQAAGVNPPWWVLLLALRRTYAASLGWGARNRLRVTETWARVRRGGASHALAVGLLAAAIALVLVLIRALGAQADIRWVAVLVPAVGILWAAAYFVGQFLLWDLPAGARLLEQSRADPMEAVGDHFFWLLHRAGRPVVFLIDHLDRCSERYVVTFLEAVQTLVRDTPRRVAQRDPQEAATVKAYFLVAADGAWTPRSYEVAYEPFAFTVSEPGRPLGHLFLEKLFQLTVPVPPIGQQAREGYLHMLLTGSRQNDEPLPALKGSIGASRSEAAQRSGSA